MEDRDLKGEKIEEVERMDYEQIRRGEKNLRNNLVQPPHSTEGESEAKSTVYFRESGRKHVSLWK